MPIIESTDGFYFNLKFQMKSRPEIKTAYLTGDFNTWGEGSIVLEGEANLCAKITLPPGSYGYAILVNQYRRCKENGKITKKKNHFDLPLLGAYHNSDLSQFSCVSGGLMEVRIAVPRGTKSVRLLCDGRLKFRRMSTVDNYRVASFLVDRPCEYAFMVDGKRYPKTGWYRSKNSTKKMYENSGIIYQIFPDRFNGSSQSTGIDLDKWGDRPTRNNFFGGTIRGIVEKLDYLKSLGVEYIYTNPIFRGETNHRYDVVNYYEIDPILGRMEDLKELISESHNRGIKVILDMVFNQSSIKFAPFSDVIEKGKNSKFYDWYIFHSDDFNVYEGRYRRGSEESPPPYETFMGYGLLPKLNHKNKEVRNYCREVARYYGNELGVDGFRLDVAHSIYLDFFRELSDDMEGEDKLIIGEAWGISPIFIKEKFWNSVTNYYLRDAIISYVRGAISISELFSRYEKNVIIHGRMEIERIMNILDSHDTVRIVNALGGSLKKAKMAYAIIFLVTGLPTIYYGDEVGMEGGRDPDNRRCFPWEKTNDDALSFFRKLAEFRKKYDIGYGGAISYNSNPKYDALVRFRGRDRIKLLFPKESMDVPTRGNDIFVVKHSKTSHDLMEKGDFCFVVENDP